MWITLSRDEARYATQLGNERANANEEAQTNLGGPSVGGHNNPDFHRCGASGEVVLHKAYPDWVWCGEEIARNGKHPGIIDFIAPEWDERKDVPMDVKTAKTNREKTLIPVYQVDRMAKKNGVFVFVKPVIAYQFEVIGWIRATDLQKFKPIKALFNGESVEVIELLYKKLESM